MDRFAIPASGPMDQTTAVSIDEFASTVVLAAKRHLQCSNNGGSGISEAAAAAAMLATEEEARRNDVSIESPRFPFLRRDGEYHLFYRWTVFCKYHQLTPAAISTLLGSFVARVSGSLPGALDLVREDRAALIALLRKNSGSKETIQATRAWILARAHSMMAVGLVCKEYAQIVVDEAASGADARPAFTRILHLIYVINDVFFNGASASTKGIYTSLLPADAVKPVAVVACFWPQLPLIMSLAFTAPNTTDADRDKLIKLLWLWKKRQIISADAVDSLLKDLCGNNPSLRNSPPAPPLVSPFVHVETTTAPPPQPPVGQEGMLMRPPPPTTPTSGGISNNSMPPNPPLFARPPPPPQQQPQHVSRFSPAPPQLPPAPAQASGHASILPASLYLPAALLATTPTAPPPMPPASLFPDVDRVSVGYMSNIMRTALKNGHPKYTPIDLRQLTGLVSAPYIEPGRLEVRMSDFYNKTAELFECVDDDAPPQPQMQQSFAAGNNTSADLSSKMEEDGGHISGEDDDEEEGGFDARIYGRM